MARNYSEDKLIQQTIQDLSTIIPEGYMSLNAFGEIFHKKLDECYATPNYL